MRTRIFLSPSDTLLVGRAANEHEHVHVILDSSSGAFTVILPDLKSVEHKEFIFYNIPETGNGNSVRVQSQLGQVINQTNTYHDLAAFDTVNFFSDLKKRWLISDINH